LTPREKAAIQENIRPREGNSREVMKRSTSVIILILIVVGISVGVNLKERRTEEIFSSEGLEIRVLEAEAKGGLIKIVEPNGEMSLFSEGVKKQELSRIARKQQTLGCQADYFSHRIKRFIRRKFTR
jgi:hypothetical protein